MIDFSGEVGLRVGQRTIGDERLLRSTWTLILATAVLSMSIHYFSGNARAVPFFISESDYPGFERVVFTLGFSTAGIMLCGLSLRLAHTFSPISNPMYAVIAKWTGLATGASLVLMSWFNMHDYIIIHSALAMITFCCGYAWSGSTHLALAEHQSGGHIRRKVWLLVGGIALLVMNLALAKPVREFVIEDGIRDGTVIMNMSQSSIAIGAPAEYFLFISLVMMLASFEYDLAIAKLRIES